MLVSTILVEVILKKEAQILISLIEFFFCARKKVKIGEKAQPNYKRLDFAGNMRNS